LESGGEAFAARKPLEEIVTESADEVLAEIKVSLASRAAEELFLQTRLNGVGGDLQHATQLALRYIVHWGMGDTFFSAAATLAPQDVYTDPGMRREVEQLLRRAYTEGKALFEQHRAAGIAVAEALLMREGLHADESMELSRPDEIMERTRRAEPPGWGETAQPGPGEGPGPAPRATQDPQVGEAAPANVSTHRAAPPIATPIERVAESGQPALPAQPRQQRPP